MKILFIGLVWGAYLLAQDAKVATAVEAPAAAVLPERPLTELENTKVQLLDARGELLKKEFNIEEYLKRAQVIDAEKLALFTAACVSIGVPAEKIRTECGASPGGTTADGKPTAGRIWMIKPEKK